MSNNVILGGKLVFPSKYLSAEDLIAAGTDEITSVIESVRFEEVAMEGGVKDTKAIISFKNRKKDFILGAKTNAKTIASLYGKVMENWIGKAITLYHTTTKVGRETKTCLRVRPVVPNVETKQENK